MAEKLICHHRYMGICEYASPQDADLRCNCGECYGECEIFSWSKKNTSFSMIKLQEWLSLERLVSQGLSIQEITNAQFDLNEKDIVIDEADLEEAFV